MKRSTIFFGLTLVASFVANLIFFSSPASAALCCKCQAKGADYCINFTDVTDCSGAHLSSRSLETIKKGNEALFQDFGCSNDLNTTNQSQCKPIAQGGLCNSTPLSPADLLSKLKENPDAVTPVSGPTKPPPQPIVPKLGVPIPGLTFATQLRTENGYTLIPFLAQYISAAYRYLVGVGVIAAIIMVMYGGFRYMLGSAMDSVKQGKKIMVDAVMGLVILLSAYLILQTVNPATLNLEAIRIQQIREEPPDTGDIARPEELPSVAAECTLPTLACKTKEECKTLCAKDPSQWPNCSPKVASPTAVAMIENSTGIQNLNGQKALPDFNEALKKAGELAAAQGYTIKVTSGFRPFKRQIELACANIDGLGGAVAYPGGSNHGSGRAADIQLWQGSKMLVCSGCCGTQAEAKYKEPSETLLKIMTDAGFKRYANEIWHFEFNTSSGKRCTAGNCAWPPSCKN